MKTTIIADCSSNHMGEIAIAFEMIDAAAEAGVDIVKFQSWSAANLRPDYPDFGNVHARHAKAELSDEDHHALIERCHQKGLGFLTTCFDLRRADFLASLGLETIKVASSDCTSTKLLEKLTRLFSQVIVSTGMSTDDEVEQMVAQIKAFNPIVLHCVSLYPTPLEHVNLERMNWIRSLGVRAGFSDHSLGVEAGMLAIAMGAEVLEKHFTLSRLLPGKDQRMSTEVDEFAALVRWREQVNSMRGSEKPGLTDQEIALRDAYIGKWGNNR